MLELAVLRLAVPVAAVLLAVPARFSSALDGAVLLSEWGTKSPLPGGSLQIPTANAVDSATGEVYVVEGFRAQKWDREGRFLLSWPCSCTGIDVNEATHEVYVSQAGSHRMARYTSQGQLIGEWGSAGSGPGEFNQPFGVSVDPRTGHVYVVDTGNARVQVFEVNGGYLRELRDPRLSMFPGAPAGIAFDPGSGSVWVTNPETHIVLKFDAQGEVVLQLGDGIPLRELGRFRWPRSVAVDGQGLVYVTDTDSERIQYFAPNGSVLGELQGPHNREQGIFHPRDIAINLRTGEKYALAAYAARVDIFDGANQYVSSFGGHKRDGLYFLLPRGIATSPITGDVYVLDTGNFLMKRVTPGGAFLLQFGGALPVGATEPGLFGAFASSALTIDPDGNLWTGQAGIHYPDDPDMRFIQKFDSDGNHLRSFFRTGMGLYIENVRHLAVEPDTRHLWSADSRLRKAQKFDSTGVLLLEIESAGTPCGIAYHDGIVYIADVTSNRIHRYHRDGTFIGSFGGSGSGDGQLLLFDSSGIATDSSGNLYVADTFNHRVQQFAPEGTFLGKVGTFGTGAGQFRFPAGVALSPDSTVLYVLEWAGHRVQSFCLPGVPLATCASHLDRDGDLLFDGRDNCPWSANGDQADADSNGIGDGCQCGDVDRDGLTNLRDALKIARGEVSSADPGFANCDVNGDGLCNVIDALRIARGEVGSDPASQLCPAYTQGSRRHPRRVRGAPPRAARRRGRRSSRPGFPVTPLLRR
jgi:DNA-binding beta-propeller fold protein YncE